jgi:hypothetical protein
MDLLKVDHCVANGVPLLRLLRGFNFRAVITVDLQPSCASLPLFTVRCHKKVTTNLGKRK